MFESEQKYFKLVKHALKNELRHAFKLLSLSRSLKTYCILGTHKICWSEIKFVCCSFLISFPVCAPKLIHFSLEMCYSCVPSFTSASVSTHLLGCITLLNISLYSSWIEKRSIIVYTFDNGASIEKRQYIKLGGGLPGFGDSEYRVPYCTFNIFISHLTDVTDVT
jgi:hypothetical protein